jgi:Protein of unknown function (DUF3102)
MTSSRPSQIIGPVAREIAKLHGEILAAAQTTLKKAIRIGELLHGEKAKLKHGEWLPWLEANAPFDRATAANYMRCFEKRDELKCKNVLHLSDAYRLIAGPGQRKKTMQTTQEPRTIPTADEADKLKKDLSKDQLALVAAELPMKIKDAANLLGVSHNTVSNARTVIKHAPERLNAIRSGKLQVAEAFYSIRDKRRRENEQLVVKVDEQRYSEICYPEGVCSNEGILPKNLRDIYNSVSRPKYGLVEFIMQLNEDIGYGRLLAIAKRAEFRRLKLARSRIKHFGGTATERQLDLHVWKHKGITGREPVTNGQIETSMNTEK